MLAVVLVTFIVTWLPSMILVILSYEGIGKYLNVLYLWFQIC